MAIGKRIESNPQFQEKLFRNLELNLKKIDQEKLVIDFVKELMSLRKMTIIDRSIPEFKKIILPDYFFKSLISSLNKFNEEGLTLIERTAYSSKYNYYEYDYYFECNSPSCVSSLLDFILKLYNNLNIDRIMIAHLIDHVFSPNNNLFENPEIVEKLKIIINLSRKGIKNYSYYEADMEPKLRKIEQKIQEYEIMQTKKLELLKLKRTSQNKNWNQYFQKNYCKQIFD
jgi:hypothetical protein